MRLGTILLFSVLILMLSMIAFRAMNTFIPLPVATSQWWGPSKFAPENLPNVSDIVIEEMAPIHFEDEKLVDLKNRLQNSRYFRSLENTNWTYGSNIAELQQFVRYVNIW